MLKQSVPMVWSPELMPPARSALAQVSIVGFDAATILISCVYYLLISREWLPLMLTTTGLSAAALLFTYVYVPESP